MPCDGGGPAARAGEVGALAYAGGVPDRPSAVTATTPPHRPLLEAAVARLAPVLPMLTELGELFAAAGHELALVGGPVRDAFLGRVSPDLDFTTDARPDEILAIGAGWADAHWDIGREFGTIGLRKGAARQLEITTYRADTYDRTSRKPEVMFGDTPRGRPRAPRLHGQRHGDPAAEPRVRRRARRPRRPRRRGGS